MRAGLLGVCLLFPSLAFAEETTRPYSVRSADELVRMTECQLLELFRAAEPGPKPEGYTPGTVISKPGSKTTVLKSKIIKKTFWQGKYFDGDVMTNKMFGIKMSKGQLADETSWIDGRPVHAIEYPSNSLVFRKNRDEIREVAPGIYLGIMWNKDVCPPKIANWFVLEACPCTCR